MPSVIHSKPADSPGYTRIMLSETLGTSQASVLVTAKAGNVTQEIHVHGQSEFDILAGATVKFPDGSSWKSPAKG